MTRFRPCIDLHAGHVKQIVGGTLDAANASSLQTNHVSELPASHFAKLYRDRSLSGAHVIMLGPGNETAAKEALAAWPGGLQVGGGITAENAARWVELGAEKVIVTSYLFPDATYSQSRLDAILGALGGDKSKLVVDLSCRPQGERWIVAINKWQTLADMEVNQGIEIAPKGEFICVRIANPASATESIGMLAPYCSEFLIHAADNEGLQRGIDEDLVQRLGEWCPIPVTYAGGSKELGDLEKVSRLSGGKVDLTIGSALDVFGGTGVKFEDCVAWNEGRG